MEMMRVNLPNVNQRWIKIESQNVERTLALQIIKIMVNDEVQSAIPQNNRSKYKGRTIYHHGNKIKFSKSSKEWNEFNLPTASKFYSEIIQEIEENKNDEGFFGHLEADDQQYE